MPLRFPRLAGFARFAAPAAVSLLAVLPACGGQSLGGASVVSNADGGTGTGTTIGSPATCAQEVTEAEAALAKIPIVESCQVDTDCAWAPIATCLSGGCGGLIVNQATASALAPAVAQVNATICTAACTPIPPPCVGTVGGPACLNGTCQDGVPTAWTSLQIQSIDAAVAVSPGVQLKCPGLTECTVWTITPDGTIVNSGTGAKTLSAADFATVNGILRGSSLGAETPSCDPAPTGTLASVIFSVERPNAIDTAFDGTGCALVGPSGNTPQTLYQIAKSYLPRPIAARGSARSLCATFGKCSRPTRLPLASIASLASTAASRSRGATALTAASAPIRFTNPSASSSPNSPKGSPTSTRSCGGRSRRWSSGRGFSPWSSTPGAARATCTRFGCTCSSRSSSSGCSRCSGSQARSFTSPTTTSMPPRSRTHRRRKGIPASAATDPLAVGAKKLEKASEKEMLDQFVQHLPQVMFALLPVAALLLKLAYARSRFYVEHLVFVTHMHSFVFLLLGVFVVLPTLPLGISQWFPFPVAYGYFVVALKRVYGQGVMVTLAKSGVLALGYTLLVALAVAAATFLVMMTL